MPGDAHQCRLNAKRCLKLAERARRPEARQAETWTTLAAQLESDKVLLCALDELDLGETSNDLPMGSKLPS
jgi:hypothetical protein